ncbi:hypothetical protein FC26_GL000452 [Paucilactobacillus vaccinostercus DSM 20634]|uniref:Uncharacterized protein n=1 Tax=Paucilactobacillus vaccinostercus DSM 20634 TaxID=1423813 RepID=A0A0R2A581_9LACO|nr:hypothetical protein FC26_GL000452 [Paucilactobacillus vaccinostercus DSM 20634]
MTSINSEVGLTGSSSQDILHDNLTKIDNNQMIINNYFNDLERMEATDARRVAIKVTGAV